MTREPGFLKRPHQKYITYQTNKYWLKFMLQLGLKNIVKSTLSQTPLPWHINNMTTIVIVLVVYLLLLKRQNNWLLKMQSQHASLQHCHMMYMHILIESNLQMKSWSIRQEQAMSMLWTGRMKESRYF